MDVELAHQIEAAKWEGDRESAASMGTPVKA